MNDSISLKNVTIHFQPDNKIVKLWAFGMDLESESKNEETSKVFFQALEQASDNKGKFTTAHYVARLSSQDKNQIHQ